MIPILAAITVCFLSLSLNAATYYVNAARPNDDGDGMTWSTAKKSIQAAIEVTLTNDVIVVTNGIYSPISTGERLVTIQSVNGSTFTTIDGASSNRCASLGGTTNVVLFGFSLINGKADYGAGSDGGTLVSCVIATNTATISGGGASNGNLNNCIIKKNSAKTRGGGAYKSHLNDCLIDNNNASYGGGVYDCILTNSQLVGNSAYYVDGGEGGGASRSTLFSCALRNNSVSGKYNYNLTYGGGASECKLFDCVLLGNWSVKHGGGSYAGTLSGCILSNNYALSGDGGGAYGGSLTNCLLTGNKAYNNGGGSAVGTLINCTVVQNIANNLGTSGVGGGASNCTLKNCIIWDNVGSDWAGQNHSGCTIDYSCSTPLPNGIGNISSDPIFLDPARKDFRLKSASPCINVGNNAHVLVSSDLAGNPRIQNATVDMGAYEGGFKIQQKITFPSLPAKTYGDAAFAPAAASSSGLAVEYASGNQAVATISNAMINIVGVGTTTIIASQPGDTIFETAPPVTNSLSVGLPSVVISPADGTTFTNSLSVTLANALPSAAIRYTLDGTEPTETSDLYTNTVNLTLSCTLKARSFAGGVAPSPSETATYTGIYTVAVTDGTIDGVSSGVYGLGVSLDLLAATTPIGYHFDRWHVTPSNADLGTAFCSTQNETRILVPPGPLSLQALFQNNSYSVTLDPRGGTVDPTNVTVAFDAVYGELPVPVRTGYTFGGWQASTNSVPVGIDSNTVVSIATDHTLTAAWTANNYTVTFDANGGTVAPEDKTVTFNAAYGELPTPVLPAPIRVDYVFGGWFTGANGTGLAVAADTIFTAIADQTLYAKWLPEDYLCGPEEDVSLATAGQYVGYFYQETTFADTVAPTVRGTFSLTLHQYAGRLTAKAVTSKGSLSFSAKAWDAVENADGTKQVALTRRGGETLLLSVRQNRIWGSLSGGSLSGEILTLDGTRNRFADRKDMAAQTVLETYKGYYTIALPLIDAVPTGAALTTPEGSGYLTLTVGSRGKVRIAGRLADGTSISQSSDLTLFDDCTQEACVPLFVPLYGRKGSVGALLWFTPGGKCTVTTDRDLGWFVRWEKPTEKADGATVLLDAVGGYYSTPVNLEDYYRFSVGTNAVPYHYNGGIAELQDAALPDGIGVTRIGSRLAMARGVPPALVKGDDSHTISSTIIAITTNATSTAEVEFPARENDAYDYSAENSARATLSFNARTGIFNGSFRLYYDYILNGRLVHKTVSVPYAGVLTPVRSDEFVDQPAGQGYYLVPDNDPALRAYRLMRSFPVWLEAAR